MRHDPGLAASPPVRYTLKVERSGYSPFLSAQEDLPWAYGCSRDPQASGRAEHVAVAERDHGELAGATELIG
jgi:hypothetical protein